MDEQNTVILLDDDDGMRRSLALALERSGYRVETYASAEQFLGALNPVQPGCLLLDLRMPGMDGLDVQEAVRGFGCTLPVIFMSGFADVPAAVAAMKGGAIDFVEKPFSVDALIARIEEAFAVDRSQRAERELRETARQRLEGLTRREVEVMHSVAEGLCNKETARRLGISPRTVEKYRARVMEKMKADNVPDLCQMVSWLGDPETDGQPR